MTASSSGGAGVRQAEPAPVEPVTGSRLESPVVPPNAQLSRPEAGERAALKIQSQDTPTAPAPTPPDALDLNSNETSLGPQPNVISPPAGGQPQVALLPTSSSSSSSNSSTEAGSAASDTSQQQWLAQVVAETQADVRQRMSQAGDQFDQSLRQLYASASSLAAEVQPPAYTNLPRIVHYYGGGRTAMGPPPSYDDVINPYAAPPTYQSLYGQMREARKSSRGLLDLLRRLLIILVSTLGCTLLIAFMILIPFTMIIVGAVYLDECRIEHIPAFLLVGGLVWASKNLLHCYGQCRSMPPATDDLDLDHHHHHHHHLGPGGRAHTQQLVGGGGGDGGHHSYLSRSSGSSGSSRSSGSSGGANSLSRHLEVALAGGAETDSNNNNQIERHLAATSSGAGTQSTPQPVDPLASLQLDGAQHSSFNYATTATSSSNHAHRHRRHTRRRLKSSICESLLNCVLFGWFIAGCVIVFRNYEPDFENPASARYCHKTVYMYTFWLISSALLLLGLFIGCVCCLMVSSAVASRRDEAGDLA